MELKILQLDLLKPLKKKQFFFLSIKTGEKNYNFYLSYRLKLI